MKAVTIAKIARLIVIIAVAVIIAIPTYAGIESYKITDGNFMVTDSIYEVGRMSAEDLASNINKVTDGESGYKINYGSVMQEPVPANVTSTSDVIVHMKDAAATDDTIKATLLKPDGSIAQQDMIMWMDGFTQYMTVGVKLGGSLVNMVKLSVSLDSVINGSRVVISNVAMEPAGDSYRMTIPMPYLVFAAAMADGANSKIGVTIGIDYNSFFDAKFRMDFPVEKIMQSFNPGGGEVQLPTYKVQKAEEGSTFTYESKKPGSPYDGVEVKQEIAIDAKGVPGVKDIVSEYGGISIGDFGGDGGGLIIEVNDEGEVQIVSDKEYLLDALESSREEDGSLVIEVDGLAEPVVVDKEQVDSLMEMFDELMSNPEYAAMAEGLGL